MIRRQSQYRKVEYHMSYTEAAKLPEKYELDPREATLRAVDLLNGSPASQGNSAKPGYQRESPRKGQHYRYG